MVAPWRLAFLLLGLLPLTTSPLTAQSEDALKRYFEGKRVTLKIAMPGTEEGVDVFPGADRPLDYPRYASRLKDNGTAIAAGTEAMITKVRVKSKHIEFQLDGGGFGTFDDELSSGGPSAGVAEKTRREKNLEKDLESEEDPDTRRAIKEELDDLRKAREREDASNRARVAEAQEENEEQVRGRRLAGGSRFNLRYRDRLPDAVLTPQGLEAALAEYVTFPELAANVAAAQKDTVRPQSTEDVGAAPLPAGGLPRKGMMTAEVEALLGAPLTSEERTEGGLHRATRTYRSADGQITAEFVEDVLVRYSMTSN